MKKKLTLGKSLLKSAEVQIESILQQLHQGEIEIKKISPKRTNAGNILWVQFKILDEPVVQHSSTFELQWVGNCCDVWLSSPSNLYGTDNDAA